MQKYSLWNFQSQDEHPVRQDGGLDEHAALQPALSPWKLPNEVSFIILLKNDNKLCHADHKGQGILTYFTIL